MFVAGAVIDDRLLLDAFLGGVKVDADGSVRARGGCAGGDFEGVEGFSGIAVAEFGEVGGGFGIEDDREVSQPAFFVGEGGAHERGQIFLGEQLELEHLRAGEERAVDAEERVLGGRADEAHDAVLDLRQKDVLLGLVEPVDLVDEEDRLGVGAAGGGGGHDAADVGDVALDTAEALEFCLGRSRDHLGEGGFSGARRAEQNERGDPVGFDRAAEELARPENVLLAGVFLERARAHAGGQRRIRGDLRNSDWKKFIHVAEYRGFFSQAKNRWATKSAWPQSLFPWILARLPPRY